MTNREKLFAKSDKELAEFLCYVDQQNLTVEVCDFRYCTPDDTPCPQNCAPAIAKWLQAEALED